MSQLSLPHARLVNKSGKNGPWNNEFYSMWKQERFLQFLNHSIFNIWRLRLVVLKIVSVDSFPTFLCPKISPSRAQIDFRENSPLVNVCWRFCYVTLCVMFWIGAEPSYFHSEDDDILLDFWSQTHSHVLPIHAKVAPHTGQISNQIRQKWPLNPWILVYVRTQKLFYRSWILLFSIYGSDWGLWL